MEVSILSSDFINFLTFKTFISTDALILFYYIGVIILPICLWFIFIWGTQKYKLLNTSYNNGKVFLWKLLSKKQKILFLLFFVLAFFFMELFWRMLFEFLIAYMQMHDALIQL